MKPPEVQELPGLVVHLDKLTYQTGPQLSQETPHGFVYFLTIENGSDREVVFFGRKWVIQDAGPEPSGLPAPGPSRRVIEGEGIVGERPRLKPGQRFSYNSFHVTAGNAVVSGSFHGVDSSGHPIFVRIPVFHLQILEPQ